MRQAFIDKNFMLPSLEIIDQANLILNQYAKNRIRLTLRQLYYQFIARDLLPDSWIDQVTGSKNSQKSYKRLGNLFSDARQAGLIDWASIEDRNRETIWMAHWKNPSEIVRAAADQFVIDKWANQTVHIEVMSEKDAATSVLAPTCAQLDVRFTANKGYGSSTLLYDIGCRIGRHYEAGKEIVVFYVGDHDPSGIDMTRDVTERLEMYSCHPVEVIRLALNWDQIEAWNPPENPAKETDPRARQYVDEFGPVSWELDAVEPMTLRQLVTEAILEQRDETAWNEMLEREQAMRQSLLSFADTYSDSF